MRARFAPEKAMAAKEALLASAHLAHRGTMTDDAIQIREFREEDLDAVVAFSLRAWEPVFESLREVLGDK
ncbi:MAG: hypothetical protein ABW114_08510, partial [Gaiellaceae bacterium]